MYSVLSCILICIHSCATNFKLNLSFCFIQEMIRIFVSWILCTMQCLDLNIHSTYRSRVRMSVNISESYKCFKTFSVDLCNHHQDFHGLFISSMVHLMQ